MNFDTLQNITNLITHRIEFLRTHDTGGFFRGPETFLDGMFDELYEVKDEMKASNHIYLEDELGDVFWDYMCLLETLEREGKIEKSRVFERCYKKFSERLSADGSDNGDWQEVKQKQKQELRKEHEIHKNLSNA